MLGLLLASLTATVIFVVMSIIYLPLIALKNEEEGVLFAREKLKFLSKWILKSLAVDLEVQYKDFESVDSLDRKKGIICVCNHQSNLDIPAVTAALHADIGFVAKVEMKSWPFFNIWMKKSKCVFLDRSNPKAGIKSIKEAVELIKKGYPIVIFPEGERSFDGKLLPFKKGSFKLATETNGVIIPITVKGTMNIQKRGEWRMKRHQKVTVVIDRPIHLDELSRDEIKNLNTYVSGIIAKNYDEIK